MKQDTRGKSQDQECREENRRRLAAGLVKMMLLTLPGDTKLAINTMAVTGKGSRQESDTASQIQS